MAANVLWNQAIDLQKVHEWDRLEQKVNMITRLQPHFLSIWTFQGWNLAYNVSVEWDAPEDKYDWIKRGIIFLEEGVSTNDKSPDLVWDVAWTYYHKFGFADEAIVLRKLFREDPDDDGTLHDRPDRRQRQARQLPARLRLVHEGRQPRRQGGAAAGGEQGRRRSSTSTSRPSTRAARATSPSGRCPPTPRPATPRPWRSRASRTSRPPSARSPARSGARPTTSGSSSAPTSGPPSASPRRWSSSTTSPPSSATASSRATRSTGPSGGRTR